VRGFIVLISFLLIQGCTVGYYTTEDMLSVSETDHNTCEVIYHIEVSPKEPERISGERLESWKQEKLSLYEAATKEVLESNNCTYKKAQTKSNANLNINVMVSINHEALAAEYLTGLSLGIIPSWGTRQDFYSYDFSHLNNQHSYSIDDVRFNHLIAFPVFWISFLTMDESNIYEDCLDNYVKSL